VRFFFSSRFSRLAGPERRDRVGRKVKGQEARRRDGSSNDRCGGVKEVGTPKQGAYSDGYDRHEGFLPRGRVVRLDWYDGWGREATTQKKVFSPGSCLGKRGEADAVSVRGFFAARPRGTSRSWVATDAGDASATRSGNGGCRTRLG
jgi:hypothetical protein